MLDEQGQQLDRVEGNLNTINAEMKQAEKTLSKMEKWCGLFTCPWNRYLFYRIEVKSHKNLFAFIQGMS